MFKKIISMILTVALIAGNCSAIFAQSVGKIKYKPAKSFTYDFFTLGETNESLFLEKLKADMDDNQDEDSFEPVDMQDNIIKDADPLNNRFMQYKPIAKAYNDFMYYNAYPEQSPYWKWTALVPDEETSEDDVLLILLKHKQLTEEILKLFKENEEYKEEIRDTAFMFLFGTAVLVLESVLLWKLLPLLRIPKLISMPILFVLDILLNDQIAYSLRNVGDMKEELDDINIQFATFKNTKQRNMFKSHIESKKIDICNQARVNAEKWKNMPLQVGDGVKTGEEREKWNKIVKFCDKNKGAFDDKDFRLLIGQYLQQEYNKLLYSKERVKYIRKEMLHIYYALLFIREELKDKSDKLRFDRALLDIATTYKIVKIEFKDGRIISWNKPPEEVLQMDLLERKGLDETDFVTYNENSEEVYTDLGNEFIDKIMTNRSYPSLLNRAQLNYIVQKIDIQRQKNKRIKQIRDEQAKVKPIITTIDKKFAEIEAKDYFYKLGTVH